MKIKLLVLLALCFSSIAIAKPKQAEIDAFNLKVKTELQAVAKDLRNDISTANSSIAKLRKDKLAIEENLKAMRDWGVAQETEKLAYYAETVQTREVLSAEKASHQKTIGKYHKVKMTLSVLAGFCFMMVYFRFGSGTVSTFSAAAGPWSMLITIAAPVLCFGIGFGLIFLLL